MAMTGERVPATRVMGGVNHPHRAMGQFQRRSFSGGSHSGFGVLGPRRVRHNTIAKSVANHQRRQLDKVAIQQSGDE